MESFPLSYLEHRESYNTTMTMIVDISPMAKAGEVSAEGVPQIQCPTSKSYKTSSGAAAPTMAFLPSCC